MAALYATKVAAERFGNDIEKHQEVMAAIADVVMDAYAVDSMVTRTRQSASSSGLDPVMAAMTQAYAADAIARSGERARRALCASSEGNALETHLQRIAPLFTFRPSIRRRCARRWSAPRRRPAATRSPPPEIQGTMFGVCASYRAFAGSVVLCPVSGFTQGQALLPKNAGLAVR